MPTLPGRSSGSDWAVVTGAGGVGATGAGAGGAGTAAGAATRAVFTGEDFGTDQSPAFPTTPPKRLPEGGFGA